MKKINRELGVTIIVITHEMKVIESICDRAAVLEVGTVAEVKTVRELFTAPQSEIAKKLILPAAETVEEVKNGKIIRIVFDGESSYKPVIANLILSCRAPLNILKAQTEDIGGKAYGQMILQLSDDADISARVMNYLNDNKLCYSEIQNGGN